MCLSCKGCKGDCPVNVDMATYKAEFLEPLLRRPTAAPVRLCVRLDPHLGDARLLGTVRCRIFSRKHPACGASPKFWRACIRDDKFLRSPRGPSSSGSATDESAEFRADGRPLRRYVQQSFLSRHRHRGDRGVGRCRVPSGSANGGRLLRTAALRLRVSSAWRGVGGSISWRNCGLCIEPESQWSCSSRVAGPLSRTNWSNMLPNDEDAKRLRDLTFTLGDFLHTKAPHYRVPKLHRKASSTATVIRKRSTCSGTERWANYSPKNKSSTRWNSITAIPTPAAAAWPARSATRRRAIITRWAWRPANVRCCPKSARPAVGN